MTISDERFELNMQGLEADGLPGTAAELRARDTAQREALAEAVGLLRDAEWSVNTQNWQDKLKAFLARHAKAKQQEAHEVGPLKGKFAEVAEQAFREQYGLQEAQGAQAGDELDAIAEAIFNADKDNWYSAGPYTQLHTNDKARLRAMARAALATQPAVRDEVDRFFEQAKAELRRARAKFPGDRIMTLALAEEFGELCKAVLDESTEAVRKEAVQVACMAARVVLDGDGSVVDWRRERGLDPLLGSVRGAEHDQ